MFGLETWGKHKSQLMLAKKPTKFMTNSWLIGRELNRRCDGTHGHQPLIDGRARDAARYPSALCRTICRGISKEKMKRACRLTAALAVSDGPHVVNVDPEEEHEMDEVDIESLIRRLEAQEESTRRVDRGSEVGIPSEPVLEPWLA